MAFKKDGAFSVLFSSVRSDKLRPVTRLAYTQPRGAPGAFGFVCLSFKTGPEGRFLNVSAWGNWFLWGTWASFWGLSVWSGSLVSFDCHALVWPFAFLSCFGDLLPRFASPAGGHFL